MKLDRVTIEITSEGWTIVGFEGEAEKIRLPSFMKQYGCHHPVDIEEVLGGTEAIDADEYLDDLYSLLEDLQSVPYDLAKHMRDWA